MKNKQRHIFSSKYVLLVLAVLVFAASYVYNYYYTRGSSINRERRLLSNHIHRQEEDFEQVSEDTVLLRKLVENTETQDEFRALVKKKWGLFVSAESLSGDEDILFWNTQNVMPPASSFGLPGGEEFKKTGDGYYVIIKKGFALAGMSNKLWVYGMIPVKSFYYIENEYLTEEFAFSKTAHKHINIATHPTNYPIYSADNKLLFYIDRVQINTIPYNDSFTVILRLLALLIFFVFAHSLAEWVGQSRGQWRGVVVLITLLFSLRLFIYFFPSVFEFRQFALFDPGVFGTNSINRSLGDLLFNSLFFSWITVYAWFKLGNRLDLLRRFNDPTRWILGIASLLFLVLSTFTLANIIKSLVADSSISFDVTNFFSLSKFSVVGFIVLASLSLGYYYFTQLMFRFILPIFENKKAYIYFGIALTGLVYLSFRATDPSLQFHIPVLLWLVLYTLLVSQRSLVINRFSINVAGIVFWIFVFSVSISAIILGENKKKEWQDRKTLAVNIAGENDEANENLLSVAITYLDNKFLAANFGRFYSEESGKYIRDSFVARNYKGYINKYDTKFYVFDSTHTGLFNEDSFSYEALNNIINVQSKPARKTNGLFYYVSAFNKITYITKRVVVDDNGRELGTVFILSDPKKSTTNALEATLFKEPESPETNLSIYSYAVYVNNKLTESTNKYPFAISLTPDQIPKEEVEQRKKEDNDELWYRYNPERVVVVARKKSSMIEAITLFSYIFCSFLFLVTFVQFISFMLRVSMKNQKFRQLFEMNIRTQVHSTIIFISILSFLIIGAATISFFIARYNRNNTDKLSRTMQVLVGEVKKKITDHSIFDDPARIYDPGSNENLMNLVNEVAEIHNVDVNIYDLAGNLKVSSQQNIYLKGVLSEKMHPEAYFHLSRLREVETVQPEKISNLKYMSIYAPVRSNDGTVYTYLNIPYFLSEFDLNQEISNFLVAIINLNAFIFLIAGVIALFITNRITRSFSIIGDKMREVNLGGVNEEIEWSRNDEIGELVKEYNKMVNKLGESARLLAKTEREGAWREMARQVAHEIKNPLTPMKLSIQYLQKAILNNSPEVKELTAKVANTLVEQIDHLSKIAFDFSQFANIGNTKMELFDLHEVIGSLKELYQQQVNLNWAPTVDKAMLIADKTQMNRLFTNLLQNAVEACRENETCTIDITEGQVDGKITVSIRDNGEGIPPIMQSKIFVPNFTTKSSGTGLGLAMCKSIVEQAHGNIWFETKPGAGTTFHVELPLAS